MLKTSEVISSTGFSLFSEENNKACHDRGFILVKSLFRWEEIQKLKAFAERDSALKSLFFTLQAGMNPISTGRVASCNTISNRPIKKQGNTGIMSPLLKCRILQY